MRAEVADLRQRQRRGTEEETMVRAKGTASQYGIVELWGFNDDPTLRALQNRKDPNFHQIDHHPDHKIAEGEQVEFAVDLQADCPRAFRVRRNGGGVSISEGSASGENCLE